MAWADRGLLGVCRPLAGGDDVPKQRALRRGPDLGSRGRGTSGRHGHPEAAADCTRFSTPSRRHVSPWRHAEVFQLSADMFYLKLKFPI